MANKIVLKTREGVTTEYALDAGVDITPGMLIELASATEVKPHATAGGDASPKFALSVEMDGRGIDDDYAEDGEAIDSYFAKSGEWINALLADGEDVAAGVLLESDGAGALAEYTPTTLLHRRAVVRTLEALDNSLGGAVARIKVEVL